MPMPIRGAYPSTRVTPSARYDSHYDPELEDYRLQQKYIQDNINCSVKFFREILPSKKGNLKGLMILETKDDSVEHCGIFLRMKGLSLVPTVNQGNVTLTFVKFPVVEKSPENKSSSFILKTQSRVTFPLDLNIPEELPPPLITAEGKLMYRMQVFITTTEGRHVNVGEVPLRWQGFKELSKEVVDTPAKTEYQVSSKRAYSRMGKRRNATIEWRVDKGGYLPGEVITVELLGTTKGNAKMGVECRAELVQKVWYQVLPPRGGGKLVGKMKVNVVASCGCKNVIEVDNAGRKSVLWRGSVEVPRGVSPSYKFDFMNNLVYVLRVGVVVAGERENWVTGEIPVVIGSGREEERRGMGRRQSSVNQEEWEDVEEIHLVASSTPQSGTSGGEVPPWIMESRLGGRLASADAWRSQSMIFTPSFSKPRTGSVSSTDSWQSFASSTVSTFKLPPNLEEMQMVSRRPTLEACKRFLTRLKHDLTKTFKVLIFVVPPTYYELDLKDKRGSVSISPEGEIVDSRRQSVIAAEARIRNVQVKPETSNESAGKAN